MTLSATETSLPVVPAKAGTQFFFGCFLDPRFRGGDGAI